MAGTDILNASAVYPQVIVSQQLSASDSSVYTAPASTSIKIAQGTMCNVTNATVYINLSLLKTGQSIDATHRVIHNYPLAGGDTLSLRDYLVGAMLGPGDMIAAFASAASSVDIVISGTVHQ